MTCNIVVGLLERVLPAKIKIWLTGTYAVRTDDCNQITYENIHNVIETHAYNMCIVPPTYTMKAGRGPFSS